MGFDVVVVLYQCDADRVSRVLRKDDRLLVHDNTELNLGFGAGANRAARQGSAELLLFINPDGDLQPGSLDVLERELRVDGVVAVEASQGRGFDRGSTPDWLSGACLAVRRDAFERAGGFEERFFMYAEDVELSFRLSRFGRFVHATDAVFVHDDGGSHRRYAYRMQHLNIRNVLLAYKWYRSTILRGVLREAYRRFAKGNLVGGLACITGAMEYGLRRLQWRPRPMASDA